VRGLGTEAAGAMVTASANPEVLKKMNINKNDV